MLPHPRRGPERGAARERGVVDTAARDEGVGERAGNRGIGIETVVEQGTEVVGRNVAPGLRGERLGLLDADPELLGRDERRDPAVPETPRPPHGRLAVPADPERHRLLARLRPDADAAQLPELAGEGDLVLAPA